MLPGITSIWHWLIVLAIVLILFGGGGKLSKLMGDFGKGLRSFKKGLKDGEEDKSAAEDIKPLGSLAAALDAKSPASAPAGAQAAPPTVGAVAAPTGKPEKA